MGMLLLIHPTTGSVIACRKGEGDVARALILDGFEPVGPRGQQAARKLRAASAKQEE